MSVHKSQMQLFHMTSAKSKGGKTRSLYVMFSMVPSLNSKSVVQFNELYIACVFLQVRCIATPLPRLANPPCERAQYTKYTSKFLWPAKYRGNGQKPATIVKSGRCSTTLTTVCWSSAIRVRCWLNCSISSQILERAVPTAVLRYMGPM